MNASASIYPFLYQVLRSIDSFKFIKVSIPLSAWPGGLYQVPNTVKFALVTLNFKDTKKANFTLITVSQNAVAVLLRSPQ